MSPPPIRPETRYAAGPEGYVAYQMFGVGRLDLMFMTHWVTNVDAMWEEPSLVAYMERLASFSRVICYDKRGTGVADRGMHSLRGVPDGWQLFEVVTAP